MENPRTKRFRDELRSTNCTLDNPTAVIMPNMTINMPPTIGDGKVTKRAPNLLKRLSTIIIIAPN